MFRFLGALALYGFVFCTTTAERSHAQTPSNLTTLWSFNCGNDICYPAYVRLLVGADGALYGTADSGGVTSATKLCSNGCGGVFKLTPPSSGQTQWTETVIYAFKGDTVSPNDGATPDAGLILDANGNLLGTTGLGGATSDGLSGTAFKVTPPAAGQTQWTETVIYNFQGNDGPEAPLLSGLQGIQYGTTYDGTVFQITPPMPGQTQWTETVLYQFCSQPNCADGSTPIGELVTDSSGALYGVTADGGSGCGARGCGTIFKLTPPMPGQTQWGFSTLYSFSGGADGADPLGGLVMDASGALYATTLADSSGNRGGAILKLSPPPAGQTQWTPTVLHTFAGGNDGAGPLAPLLSGTTGIFYGTTAGGGGSGCGGGGCGTVFKLEPPPQGQTQWIETVLYRFNGNDGSNPIGALVASQGYLYGVTLLGGAYGTGTVFQLTNADSPTLQVTPPSGIVSAGPKNGPFTPSSFAYQLSASAGSIDFSISGMPTWLNASFTSGTITPSQPLTVTFTLTAAAKSLAPQTATITFTNKTNGQGNTTRTATLTVNGPSPTCSLRVSPATINLGQKATLSWTSANATGVTIDNGIGSVSASGSHAITPTQTTTYTGTFVGPGGSVNCQATITVSNRGASVSCTLTVAPLTIRQGQGATLSWISSNATSGKINQGIGSVKISASTEITPAQTTTYTGTFSGQGGSTSCSATVTVTPLPAGELVGLDTSPAITTLAEAQAIKNAGYQFVIQYLRHSADSLTANKAANIKKANLKIVSVYENSNMTDTPNQYNHGGTDWMTYFSTVNDTAAGAPLPGDSIAKNNGYADAKSVAQLASSAGQPFGTPIYFAVDLEQSSAFDGIQQYFEGLNTYFNSLPINGRYLVGAYGASDTLYRLLNPVNSTQSGPLAQYYWLSTSWPDTKNLIQTDILNLWQPDIHSPSNDFTPSWLSQPIDIDYALKGDYGSWIPK